jgi:hypothetical protein
MRHHHRHANRDPLSASGPCGKNGKQVDAGLRGHGEWGWECQFLYNGELAYGRRWVKRADALAEPEEKGVELERGGWQQVEC